MEKEITLDLERDIENIANNTSISSLLNVICRTTGMRFSAVARVTDEKWITCQSQDEIDFGLEPGSELVLETTICDEIRQHHNPVIIEKVSEDLTYCDHHTPAKYGFESYISFPIFRKDGRFFGTLCAIDPAPAKLNNKETRELFQLYTELISFHLEKKEEIEILSSSLLQEKKAAELRETFIAVLGHDLRNPIATIRMSADILLQTEISEYAKKRVGTIKATSYRMQNLIDSLLDFAKGRMGEGIQLELRTDNEALEKSLNQVIREFDSLTEDREIQTSIFLEREVSCDANRIAQLLSNLVGNAVKHGDTNEPIFVQATTEENTFSLKVLNAGRRIPERTQKSLFKPFFRTSSKNDESGLGLGLYICSEIAKAHGGEINVESTALQTSFEFVMPL